MDQMTFNAKSSSNLWIFTNSVQYSGFTETTHKNPIEQSKHNTSPLLDINLV